MNLSDDQGYTALLHAVQGPAAIALVPTLLKVKTIEVEQTGNDLGTPLWWAAHGSWKRDAAIEVLTSARVCREQARGGVDAAGGGRTTDASQPRGRDGH